MASISCCSRSRRCSAADLRGGDPARKSDPPGRVVATHSLRVVDTRVSKPSTQLCRVEDEVGTACGGGDETSVALVTAGGAHRRLFRSASVAAMPGGEPATAGLLVGSQEPRLIQ